MGAPEGAHPRLVRVRLAGGPTPALTLGGTGATTGRGTGEPTARVDTAQVCAALTVRPARAEPELAAGPGEVQACARSRAGVYPAVAVRATPTRDRHVAWGATAAIRLDDAFVLLLGERRRVGAGENRGRPGDGRAGTDPLDHPPSGDAFLRLELLWTHELTSSHLSTSCSGPAPEYPEPASGSIVRGRYLSSRAEPGGPYGLYGPHFRIALGDRGGVKADGGLFPIGPIPIHSPYLLYAVGRV